MLKNNVICTCYSVKVSGSESLLVIVTKVVAEAKMQSLASAGAEVNEAFVNQTGSTQQQKVEILYYIFTIIMRLRLVVAGFDYYIHLLVISISQGYYCKQCCHFLFIVTTVFR